MLVNRALDPPPGKPCIRDLHDLLRDHLPAPLVMLTSLEELARRCREIAATHPRFREELPLVLAGEERRRQKLSGVLVAAGATRSQVA